MALVAEQQGRKYAPCPKNATAFKRTGHFCSDSFAQLMMPFPSRGRNNLDESVSGFAAACLSWKCSTFQPLLVSWQFYERRVKSCLSFRTATSSTALLIEMRCFLGTACLSQDRWQKF